MVVVACSRRHGHRDQVEFRRQRVLYGEALFAERCGCARAAAEQRHEDARLGLLQPLDVAAEFVDPDGDLHPEGRGHGVLAVRAAGDRVVRRALGEVREVSDHLPEQVEHDRVRTAQLQDVAGLGDVLGGRAPVRVAAGVALAEAVELPDERHDRVAGDGEAVLNALEVEVFEPAGGHDPFSGFGGDHAQPGLRAGERSLDIEPGLPACIACEQRADARLSDACRSGSFLHLQLRSWWRARPMCARCALGSLTMMAHNDVRRAGPRIAARRRQRRRKRWRRRSTEFVCWRRPTGSRRHRRRPLMADLGADVVKIENPLGDAWRGMQMRGQSPGWEPETGVDAAFELDNRGKRGVALSLELPDAVEAVHRLVEQADIFITNLTAPRIARYDLSVERLQEIKPDLIYVVLTGYGTRGPDAAMTAYDYSAFWSRSGIMGLIGDPDGPPMPCRPGQGDHATSLNLLAATLAALRLRDQTGEGQRVEVTLQRTGAWTIGADVSAALITGRQPARIDRVRPGNPLFNSYETADGRWLMLVMPTSDRHWPPTCRAMETARPD